MQRRWVGRAWLVAWVGAVAACSDTGGPHPEVPILAGAGGISGDSGGSGGSGGSIGVSGVGGLGGVGGVGGMGGTGGGAGMAAGGSGGSSGGGGEAGTGTPMDDGCSDSDSPLGVISFDPNPFDGPQVLEKGRTVGTNGVFEDACDEGGDLIEHICETRLACGSGGAGFGGSADAACAPSEHPTGLVVQQLVDCFGLCADGACQVPCPEAGDELTVSAADALAEQYELDPGIDGLRYVCWREPCAAPAPSAGDVLAVTSIAAPDDVRLDCRELFSDPTSPLTLSDGCHYVSCSARRPSGP